MAATADQVQALTDAISNLEKKIGSSGGSGGGSGSSGGGVDTKGLSGDIKTASKDFAGAMLQGTQSVTGFAESAGAIVKNLPGLGPIIKTIGVEAIKYIETSQKSFNALAKAGMGFEGNLGALNRAAAATRMPLDQFTKLVGNNSANLAAFGAGTTEGAKRFSQLSNAMFEGGAIDNFMALGYSIEEANEFLLDNTALQRRSGRFQAMTAREQAASAANMAKEMDIIAKLTGKQVKDIKNEMMERQNTGATQAKLRLLEKQGVAGATDAYNAAQKGLQAGPKVLGNLMDDLLQTGVPMSEATANFAATNKEAYALAKQAAEATKAGNVEEAQRLSEAAAAAALKYADSEAGLRLSTLSQVSSIAEGQAQALEEVGGTIDALNERARQMEKATGRVASTQEAFANLMEELRTESEKQVALQAPQQQALKFMNEATQGLANSSKVARDGVAGLIETNTAFTGALGKAATSITEAFDPESLSHLADFASKINSEATKFQEKADTGVSNDATSEELSKKRREDGSVTGDPKEVEASPGFFKSIANSIGDAVSGWFSDNEPDGRATGGTISAGNSYMTGERGREIITKEAGTVLSNTQSDNAIASASENGTKDMTKLLDSVQTLIDQNSTMIALNSKQAMLSDKQIKVLRSAGNMIKGI